MLLNCFLVYFGVVKLSSFNLFLVYFGAAKLTFVILRGCVVSWWLALLVKSLMFFTGVKPCWLGFGG